MREESPTLVAGVCQQSSAWAERGFCKNCGSHLFYRLKENK